MLSWVSGQLLYPLTCSMAQIASAGITEEVLAQRLRLIRQQVKLFSSNDHVRALQAGGCLYL